METNTEVAATIMIRKVVVIEEETTEDQTMVGNKVDLMVIEVARTIEMIVKIKTRGKRDSNIQIYLKTLK